MRAARRPPRLGPPGGARRDATHEVDRLTGPAEGPAPQLLEVLGVAVHPGPALLGLGLVGRRAAVDLMERALAQDRAHGDVGRRSQPLVQLQVGVATPGHGEPLLEPPDLLELGPGHEHAVALPDPVEPVTVADEVADLEQPVAVGGPLDALEEAYPVLRGTIRDHDTAKRRPFLRFFACEEDLSHESPDAPLPDAVASGAEPFFVVGAIAGG